ncbi:hypothetical protein BJX63DRAFT_429055 [Aspergillus granulosus]|uniref:Uncharacterized protein n=1 Tax=Aspergillus granulosus TaxID=176169 RepID=A0ABR4HSU5_9EURO
MKVFQTVILALAGIPALASAAPSPPSDPSAPRTAILTFKPARGKADQLEKYVKDGQAYILANVPACLDIWYFWSGGKKDHMIVGERRADIPKEASHSYANQEHRYTNQSALWDWALSEEHTNIAKDLPKYIDIFSTKVQADISIDLKDLIK